MSFHGDRSDLNTKSLSASRQHQPRGQGLSYRSFGALDFETDPEKTYQGHPDEGKAGDKANHKTERMFAKLIQRMSQPFRYRDKTNSHDKGNDNPNIPAGYTYLAQLVAHDMTQNTAFPTKLSRISLRGSNERRRGLMLDTVYGAGPLQESQSYELPASGESFRSRLRTSSIDPEQIDVLHPEPKGCPFLLRDLPRSLQSDLSDGRKHGRPDVLIPDIRNDDQAMVSQVTTLFHQFHNAVLERLRARGLTFDDADDPAPDDIKLFETARAIVTRCYRKIIRNDLLLHLLNVDVYEAYRANDFKPMIEAGHDFEEASVSLEFSHAAYRIGHAMVRVSYQFNDAHDPQGLSSALLRSSSAEPRFFPLRTNWVAQWSKFFDLRSKFFELDLGAPQNARRIGPSYNEVLLLETQFANRSDTKEVLNTRAGLLLRDLTRGTQAGVLKLDALIDRILGHKKAAAMPFMKEDMVRKKDVRAKFIKDWLQDADPTPIAFTRDEIKSLSEDPPLLFWILLEAAAQESGKRLGTIGSIILAETMASDMQNEIELPKSDVATDKLERHVFGGPPPDTMPDMIEFVTKVLKLNYVTPRFI